VHEQHHFLVSAVVSLNLNREESLRIELAWAKNKLRLESAEDCPAQLWQDSRAGAF
jgi:hypothetical protein